MKPNQRSNNSTENYRACVPALLAIVKDLAPRDAIAALIETAHALPNADNAEFIIFPSSASNLIRRTKGGRLSKIESDPELKSFLLAVYGYHTIMELVRMCQEKFGMERAPSKSGLQRFISKITRQIERERGDHE